jgi:5-methylcytosine-specific restriction endonuclease McrA
MLSVLDQPTLILNKNWTAIGTEPVRDAICKVSKDAAQIIDHAEGYFQQYTWEEWTALRAKDGEDFIATGCGRVRVPDVIVLNKYEKVHTNTVMFNRKNLFSRDRNMCQYCRKRITGSDCTIDHIIPQCQGGRSTWENCVLACVDCNVAKGGRTPRQAKMTLIRPAAKPKWNPIFRTKTIKPIWGKFMDLDAIISEMYWQVELQP